jgi:threonine dehydratase
VLVTEDEIAAAILALMEQQKLVAEGAGAVAVAAAMFGKVDLQGKKAVCLVSGGNIDVTILSRVINRGLLMSGRNCQLTVELMDKPGQLNQISRIVSEQGGNIISVHHERGDERLVLNGCYVYVTLETRNFEHIEEIRRALTDFGFEIIE